MRFLTIVLLLVLGGVTYIRLAPTNAGRWHKIPDVSGPGDVTGEGSFLSARRITGTSQELLEALEKHALATSRTRILKGSVAEGMITFQTRSAVIGFPDQTTVAVKGDLLVMYGRLRFGRKDFGVNRSRIAGWLEALGPLTERL